jgi:hypothetical protein
MSIIYVTYRRGSLKKLPRSINKQEWIVRSICLLHYHKQRLKIFNYKEEEMRLNVLINNIWFSIYITFKLMGLTFLGSI